MPVMTNDEAKQGIFANPTYGVPSNEEQKAGLFANPSYGTSGLVDPATSRLELAGVLPGGGTNSGKQNISTNSINFVSGNNVAANDWRVRVSVASAAKVLYNSSNPGILSPLRPTDGVIFPYVPSVTVAYAARYSSQPLTHSNYNNFFYEGSEVQTINIVADFTVQNTDEASYFLAALYFFRAATKMFYGNSGEYQGSPPPIVYLDGYGQHYLPHVPCVVQQFSHTMPADVDYIETMYPSGALNRVPTSSQFTLALQPVYSRSTQANFSYDSFASGDLILGNGGGRL